MPAPSGPIACPQCGAQIPDGFKFCGSCGSKLADLPVAPITPAAAPVPAPEEPVEQPAGQMVLIRPDGSEGGAFPLYEGDNVIGREVDALFESDFYLSPRHVNLRVENDYITLMDEDSLNGVFYRIYDDRSIEDGAIFRIGQELLRFDNIAPPQPLEDGTEIMGSPNPGYWGRVAIISGDGVDGNAYLLKGEAAIIGREGGEIQFPEDGYVSGSHLEISNRGGQVKLTDLNSSNGTFIKIEQDETVESGTFVLVGQQLFRIELA